MRRRSFIGWSGTALAAPAMTACVSQSDEPGLIVNTQEGSVRGRIIDGVHRFLGIPYAEAPFGPHRFLPPKRRSPWQGVLDASKPGLICPQTGGLGSGDLTEGEDCLNLNVWTPDPLAGGLPVMVWAHGGGQVSGSGADAIYDGTQFAKQGVVLITNNRRLGAEGYLYLQEHFGDGIGPGNLGILDQIEVLRWVQRNVAKFGGDPNNVTLFGESGGGAATQAVVATTTSNNLLHRVIPQSGGHAAQRPEQAHNIAAVALQQLGIKPGDKESLQRQPWQDFVSIYKNLQSLPEAQPQVYLPVINELMPLHPVDANQHGMGAELDYLIGTCREEMNLFDAFPGDLALGPFRQRRDALLASSGISLEDLRRAYRQENPTLQQDDLELAILGDLWFRLPSIRIAEQHSLRDQGATYMYRFDWQSALLGAAHAMDLMVFGNGLPFPGMAGLRDFDDVAEQMRQCWISFASDGNPSTPSFSWPKYSQEQRQTASINQDFSMLADPYHHQRQILEPLLTKAWSTLNV